MPDGKKLKNIKTSVFSRSMSLAKFGLSAGVSFAASRIKNTPLDEYLNTQAIHLTKELGELKGSMMKAGQMLSIYGEHFLPPEANRILKTLQSDSPVIEWSVMQNYLRDALDEKLIEQLEINPEPIGSASMGQVYLATDKSTGDKIALKIQYPDVDKAIDSDVAALRKVLSFSKLLPSSIDTGEIFDEIKVMLRQELDYTHEADLTEEYGRLIADDVRFKVPRVFRKYSNKKVLATEFVEGLKADHALIQSLSVIRRNRLAENFLDLYFKEIFLWGFIQTDPHLGNYKIQIDSKGNDRIVLLDFGAAKHFKSSFLAAYRKMIKGAVLDNDEFFFEGCKKLGFIIDGDSSEYIAHFKSFCQGTIEPFLQYNDPRNTHGRINSEGHYDWKQTDLPSRVMKNAFKFKDFELRTPPRDILFLDRKTAGVFMFLNVLRAQINAHKIINPYLKQIL
jgi:predicted unusual protein kinase regulating ubiquinone biosynthesis (AarF/ABC1/UbiB family)